jgi:hypothetical protein
LSKVSHLERERVRRNVRVPVALQGSAIQRVRFEAFGEEDLGPLAQNQPSGSIDWEAEADWYAKTFNLKRDDPKLKLRTDTYDIT